MKDHSGMKQNALQGISVILVLAFLLLSLVLLLLLPLLIPLLLLTGHQPTVRTGGREGALLLSQALAQLLLA